MQGKLSVLQHRQLKLAHCTAIGDTDSVILCIDHAVI